VQMCATPSLCDVSAHTCDPPVCTPGQYQCAGAMLTQCNAGQTGFAPTATCSSSALCDSTAGRCDDAGAPDAACDSCAPPGADAATSDAGSGAPADAGGP
jgi:hypothetical protein